MPTNIGVSGPITASLFTQGNAYSPNFRELYLSEVHTLNLARRQLGPVAWARMFAALKEARGIKAGRGQNQGEHSATVAELAAEVGVPLRTAERRTKLAEDLEPYPDTAQRVDAGDATNWSKKCLQLALRRPSHKVEQGRRRNAYDRRQTNFRIPRPPPGPHREPPGARNDATSLTVSEVAEETGSAVAEVAAEASEPGEFRRRSGVGGEDARAFFA